MDRNTSNTFLRQNKNAYLRFLKQNLFLLLFPQLYDFEVQSMKDLFDKFVDTLNQSPDQKDAVWADNLNQYWINTVQEMDAVPAPSKDTPKPILPANLIPR